MEYVLIVVFMIGTDTWRGPEFRQGVTMQEFKSEATCQAAAKQIMEMAIKIHPNIPQGSKDPKIQMSCIAK